MEQNGDKFDPEYMASNVMLEESFHDVRWIVERNGKRKLQQRHHFRSMQGWTTEWIDVPLVYVKKGNALSAQPMDRSILDWLTGPVLWCFYKIFGRER